MSTNVDARTPARPTAAGQRVRTLSYGGNVRMWMDTGVVAGFTTKGNPVVDVDDANDTCVTDTLGCFRRIDEFGRWIRESEGAGQ